MNTNKPKKSSPLMVYGDKDGLKVVKVAGGDVTVKPIENGYCCDGGNVLVCDSNESYSTKKLLLTKGG